MPKPEMRKILKKLGLHEDSLLDSEGMSQYAIDKASIDSLVLSPVSHPVIRYLTQAALCVPVGQKSFFRTWAGTATVIIDRQAKDKFAITIRGQTAAYSYGAEYDGVSRYLFTDGLNAYLGKASELYKLMATAATSIARHADGLSEKLTTQADKKVFLGPVGDPHSPEKLSHPNLVPC